MKPAWALLGRVLSRMLRPFIGYYIKDTERARLLMLSQGKVLLVQDWLGSQRWSLPGGGLHATETPQEAAARELHEETGIKVKSETVTFVTLKDVSTEHNLQPYRAAICSVTTPNIITPKVRRPELLDAAWFGLDSLPADIDPLVQEAIDMLD